MNRLLSGGGGQNRLKFPFILKLKQKFQRFRRKKRLNSRLLHYVEKLTPPTYLTKIDIHLADSCNLNCFGCSHFSQIAQSKFLDIQAYERDIKALSAVTQGFIGKIQLMGGEPLAKSKL